MPHAPFRAEHVGSFLRPASLLEARAAFAAGTLDAAGLPLVESLVEEASAMGAAAMAMAATGEFASVEDAARSLATRGPVTEPDPAAHAVYTELGELQAEAYECLAPVFEAQHAFARRHPLA